MAENYEVIKGFQTKQGLGRYDYDYLHNKPDLATQEKAGLLSPEDKVRIDQIDEIKQSVDEIDYPVDSVNGKIGQVKLTKEDIGLNKVENKSSEEIRNEITKENVTGALGYTPLTEDEINEAVQGANNAAQAAQTTANQAVSLAQNAQTAADDAQTAADSADSKAQAAQTIAERALQGVATAQNAITETREVAEDAHERIDDLGPQSVQGEIITLSDSDEAPLWNLKLYGKTTQFTTTGKNLLKYPYTYDTRTIDGVTFTVNPDGTILANGTASQDNNATFIIQSGSIVDDIPLGKYVLSGCPSGGESGQYCIQWWSHSIEGGTARDYGAGVIIDRTAIFSGSNFAIRIEKGRTVNNLLFKPMIRRASVTDPTYEPYTGGVASPNPDYPQELESVGDDGSVAVTVCGKNLFPPEATDASHTYTLPVGTYYFRRFFADSVNTNARTFADIGGVWTPLNKVGEFDNGSIIVYDSTMGWGEDKQKIVFKKEYELYTMLPPAGDTLVISVDGYATEFVPYIEPRTLTVQTPNGLPGIPVSSGGNYTDEKGQQWICDEIDFARGKYVQRVARVTVNDGSLGEGISDSNVIRVYTMSLVGSVNSKTAAISNVLTRSADSWYYSKHGNSFSIADDGRVFFCYDGFSTFSEWKARLVETPIVVLYELATPIETDLTAEELANYSALHTNCPNTTIYNDEGAGMSITYSSPNTALPISGGRMAGPIDMNNNSLTGLAQPQKDNDAATKTYVDELVKNIDLSNYPTKEEVNNQFEEFQVEVDPTLSEAGQAADAQAVGQAINQIDKSFVGLDKVENKSSEEIRSEITDENVVNALGYTPPTQEQIEEMISGFSGFIAQSEPPEDIDALWIDTDDETAEQNELDDSLTIKGMAADAKAVGDAIADMVYSDENDEYGATVPLNADTLGGRPASEFATENFVVAKIAEAKMEGSDVDLSGYATKDDVSNAVRAIDFPVDSINGKTGAIQLSASDVDARPSTWTPTASEVGARPNTWLPTIGDIGAAPSGHGLGADAVDKTWSDVDSLVTNGWYRFQNINVTLNNVDIVSALVRVDFYGGSYGVQTLYAVNTASGSGDFPILQRTRGYGGWQPWECINPPLKNYVEYRTIERWEGKVVYCKMVSCGALVSAGSSKTIGINVAPTRIIRHCGFVRNDASGAVVSLPIFDKTIGADIGYHIVNEGNIYMVCATNATHYTSSWVTLWYTKD